MRYSEGYGVKSSNICVNNRCYNDPRFPEFHVDGYENDETHEVSVGNNPLSKNLSLAITFTAANSGSPTAKFQVDRIGAFIHTMTGGSIPRAAVHQFNSGNPGTKLFDLEPLRDDDGHIDYFIAPRDAQALNRSSRYMVVFTEGGGDSASYKLYATAKTNEDDNRHPRWPIDDASISKDDDATNPAWAATRSGNTLDGVVIMPQIQVYARRRRVTTDQDLNTTAGVG